MFEGLFKRTKYITVNPSNVTYEENSNNEDANEQKPNIPNGMWVKCDSCGCTIYKKDLEKALLVCSKCNKHFRMNADDRVKYILDTDSFLEYDENMKSCNPLEFPDYTKKIKNQNENTGMKEAVITGEGTINGKKTIIAVMDSRFMMASMGSVVGEKITRAVEKATSLKLPIVIFTASGGARMQEGMFSLMQMAKVSAAIAKHNEKGLLYITVLTDPTTGGVSASFAMLGDIILAEPEALIGFAGKRVIEQTIKQNLPEGFQKAEFLLQHGFIDKIVDRKELKETLSKIIDMHTIGR